MIIELDGEMWDEASFLYYRREHTKFNRNFPPSFGQVLGEVAFADYFNLPWNKIRFDGKDPGWTFRVNDWLVHLSITYNSEFESFLIRGWDLRSDIYVYGDVKDRYTLNLVGWIDRKTILSNAEMARERLSSRHWGRYIPLDELKPFEQFARYFRKQAEKQYGKVQPERTL